MEDRHRRVFEVLRTGELSEMQGACEEVARYWKDVPVEPLLALKEQFQRMGLEHREAHLEEALASVAEKRPEPFVAIASDTGHPLWRQTVEVLALTGERCFLELLLKLADTCPKKFHADLVKALGAFADRRAGEAAAAFLSDEDDGVFFEAVMALKRHGAETLPQLKGALIQELQSGSDRASLLKEVIYEIENAA